MRLWREKCGSRRLGSGGCRGRHGGWSREIRCYGLVLEVIGKRTLYGVHETLSFEMSINFYVDKMKNLPLILPFLETLLPLP